MFTFGKICHPVKDETHLKNGHTVKNWVTFEKVSHIWKNGPHCEKVGRTVKNGSHIQKRVSL